MANWRSLYKTYICKHFNYVKHTFVSRLLGVMSLMVFYAVLCPLFFAPKIAYAHSAANGDINYYFYGGGGMSFGGMSDKFTASGCPAGGLSSVGSNDICLSGDSVSLSNGFVSGGTILGMQGHFGIEMHVKGRFYFATEVYSNIGFSTSTPSTSNWNGNLEYGGGTVNNPNAGCYGVSSGTGSSTTNTCGGALSTAVTIPSGSVDIHNLSLTNGTDGYQGIFNNYKIGLSFYQERLIIYGIIGWGWTFAGLQSGSQIYSVSNGGTGNPEPAGTIKECTNCAYNPGNNTMGGVSDNGVPGGPNTKPTMNGNTTNGTYTINPYGPAAYDGNTYYQATLHVRQTGPTMNLGFGMAYYITRNLGFYCEFIDTAPFARAADGYVSIQNINALSYNQLNAGATTNTNTSQVGISQVGTYAINMGLNVRF